MESSSVTMSEQVPPTRMALQLYKAKKVGAKKGYELLKRKSDALKVRNAIISQAIYGYLWLCYKTLWIMVAVVDNFGCHGCVFH